MDVKNFVITQKGHIRPLNRNGSFCRENVKNEVGRMLTESDLVQDSTCKVCKTNFFVPKKVRVSK